MKTLASKTRAQLRLGFSPDPDDAFMWWPLLERDSSPAVIQSPRFRFEGVTTDIEGLNRRAESADSTELLEITAISCAHYPNVQQNYAITSCGASFGEQYGPRIVAAQPTNVETIRSGEIELAVPGERTTAFTVASIALGRGFRYQIVPFDQIIPRVQQGDFNAGLIIHEGQLTHEDLGLHLVLDLGRWWWDRHQLPLPLGLNVIRRDLEERFGHGTLQEITELLKSSIRHALAHRTQGITYALNFARNMSPALADQYVGMYVNDRTVELGVTGERAIRALLRDAAEAGICRPPTALDIVRPNPVEHAV